ncbi:MAG: 30S ribosomal protein S18 [Clostridia bacterium]|nr:30S ribosomal protein S18 [Clostridia bacterium]MDD4375198.1 30S ribosomal protein S18 [Clostridia bacterium]
MADNRNNKRGAGKDKPFRRPRKKICIYCANKEEVIDYKDLESLKKFVSDKGKILPRRATGACAKHQRKVTEAIKRARTIALLPYSAE